METKLRKNDEYICIIESYTSEGYGVARINGQAVFVPNSILGETHRIILIKITSSYIIGKSLEIIEISPHRTNPKCQYFGKCGGCHLQHMSYDEQLRFKKLKVLDALKFVGKMSIDPDKLNVIPSNNIERYRNKAVFNVCDDKYGYFKSRSHELVEIDDCLLVNRDAFIIASALDLSGLNHISIRDNVCVVYGKSYRGDIPEGLTGLVLCKNNRDNSLLDGDFSTIWGNPNQIEDICNLQISVSPQSFLQVNSSTVADLYNIACSYAGYGNLAFELYCGVGIISLCLSKRFKKVKSIEIVPEAIENAKFNCDLNSINNVDFICGDADIFNEYINEKPDVIVVDPPRKGLSSIVVNSILESEPLKIVYISCNPSTLARDVQIFSSKYYLDKITIVDMFPNTYHVETVVLMSKYSDVISCQ